MTENMKEQHEEELRAFEWYLLMNLKGKVFGWALEDYHDGNMTEEYGFVLEALIAMGTEKEIK